jgi:hypothetical protein
MRLLIVLGAIGVVHRASVGLGLWPLCVDATRSRKKQSASESEREFSLY